MNRLFAILIMLTLCSFAKAGDFGKIKYTKLTPQHPGISTLYKNLESYSLDYKHPCSPRTYIAYEFKELFTIDSYLFDRFKAKSYVIIEARTQDYIHNRVWKQGGSYIFYTFYESGSSIIMVKCQT